jgi:hypothetical protein
MHPKTSAQKNKDEKWFIHYCGEGIKCRGEKLLSVFGLLGFIFAP